MPSAALSTSEQQQAGLLPVGAACEVIDAKTGAVYSATVLSRRWGSSSNPPPGSNVDDVQYYIHRHDQDKRMDGWVDQASIRLASITSAARLTTSYPHATPLKGINGTHTSSGTTPHAAEKGKRKAEHELVHEGSDGSRTPSVSRQASPAIPDRAANHRAARHKARDSSPETPALRNIDRVLYGNFDIKTWYYSPYPLDHDDEDGAAALSSSSHSAARGGASKRDQSPSTSRLASNSSSTAIKRAARKDSSSGVGGALSASARDAPAIKSLAAASTSGADSSTSSSRQSPSTLASPANSRSSHKKDHVVAPTKMLWICDGCFKYMKTYNGFAAHRKFCRNTHPPGRKVYQRGAHIIWEVDGASETLYCQNLSLFGKLFIDHKTIYFDVEPFTFYVLTDAANASFDHPLGFFSKEKVSYDDYNLACIVTFPPFQRKSFGTLMIEFSYYLSAGQGMLGTPERPLSDLGLKGYLSFWTAVLMRALITCFDGPLKPLANSAGRQRRASSAVRPTDAAALAPTTAVTEAKVNAEDALRKWQILSQRCKVLNVAIESISHQPGFAELQQLASEADNSDANNALGASTGASTSHKRKLRLKGWAGSIPSRHPRPNAAQQSSQNGTSTAAQGEGLARRSSRVAANGASSGADKGIVHPALDISRLHEGGASTMAITVESLSRLTHLRSDDIVLALSEAGLVDTANTPFLPVQDEAVTQNASHANGLDEEMDVKVQRGRMRPAKPPLALLLTRDALREAITRFNIRPAVLDESYALI